MADWTIIKVLEWTESYFKQQTQPDSSDQLKNNSHSYVQVDSPRLTAEILLAHILGLKRIDLYLQHDRPLEKKELADFKAAIKKRLAGEPVAYITGVKGFWEAEFEVAPGVLIPRPDTETLVEEALKFLNTEKRSTKILELGAGSGAIVVSLAQARPEHFYVANDLSQAALAVCQKNNKKICQGAVHLFGGSWFDAIRKGVEFDLIVSNPPYIATPVIEILQPEVRLHEPLSALDGGSDGLYCYRNILKEAHHYLKEDGQMLLEIGFDQKQGVETIVEQVGRYQNPEFIKDLAGHDRVAKLKK